MPLRALLRIDLKEAREVNDSERIALIRTLIAVIDNAEAVDVPSSLAAGVSGEVPRRRLPDNEIVRIVLREGAELRAAAEDYEKRGRSDEAARLRSLSQVADRYAAQMK